ncbi:hypothetical protein HLB44_13640 [Aquincola sp. S2]|uniref:Uncharacterized protein n=1 Tax=Pseudaquabacterium terrae TaxID=2732868 RepID=A0ABX2EHD1_9BURK|nr:hypothetical protein [Aquabacterium terrae]NRF68031.1 hypothetical protein [Aquabacterium terrae]
MSTASMTFGRSTRLTAPRGALWFGNAAAALINFLRRVDQWQLKRARSEPQNAEEVLTWARSIEASDPGFAADLRAAVYRSQSRDN